MLLTSEDSQTSDTATADRGWRRESSTSTTEMKGGSDVNLGENVDIK